MIKLKNIDKYFSNKFVKNYVLRRIDIDIKKGEFISIMGPSGSGKTTLLNILGMLDTPSEGEYYFMDEPVYKFSEKKLVNIHKNHIGFVFQNYNLIDDLNVYENLEMPLIYNKISKKERKSMVAEMLDKFNIVAKQDLFPQQLSGGQQQLVGIARAIIARPNLILADEPTGNLHSDQGREIMKLLKKLNSEGTTVVQVTHSEENATFGDRIINLKDGWIE